MFKLSKLADYGIVIMAALEPQEAPVSASVLADQVHLPEPTVAKVLKILGAAKLVISTRGIKGGYQIDKPLSEISVKEIITAIDGPIALTACVEGSDGCELSHMCALHGRWDQVNQAIKLALENVTLADMLQKPLKKIA